MHQLLLHDAVEEASTARETVGLEHGDRRRACARGLKTFDYGRSKRGTGSFDFKKNWGFEPQPLHYEYRLFSRESIPQNNPNNPKYRLMIQAWRRMPIGMANCLGPHLVRSLG